MSFNRKPYFIESHVVYCKDQPYLSRDLFNKLAHWVTKYTMHKSF